MCAPTRTTRSSAPCSTDGSGQHGQSAASACAGGRRERSVHGRPPAAESRDRLLTGPSRLPTGPSPRRRSRPPSASRARRRPPVHVPYARTGAEPDVVVGTGPRRPSPPRSLALLGSRALARLARGDRDRARRWRRHGVLGPQSAPADRRGHARARDSRAGEREHGALRRAAVERGRVGLRSRVHGRVALPDRKREPRGRLDVQARRRPLLESTGADGPPAADHQPRRGRGGSAGQRSNVSKCAKIPTAKVRWACLVPGASSTSCVELRVVPWVLWSPAPSPVCPHLPALQKPLGKGT